MSPTALSLRWLRREGFIAARLEHWNHFGGVRQDLWGCDLLACHSKERLIVLIQVTSVPNLSSRLKKLRARAELAAWIAAGGLVQLHGWAKHGGKWRVKRIAVTGEDLAAVTVQSVPRRRRAARQPDLFEHTA